MDFNDTEEQALFRAKAKSWLAATAHAERPGVMAGNQEDRYQQAVDWYHTVSYTHLTLPTNREV